MADNVNFTPGSGASGATDEIGGVHYPRVKIALGADGVAVDAGAGAGAVGTDTQRTTLASDDPAVALLGTIDADTGASLALLTTIDADTGASLALLSTIDADTGAHTGLLTTIDADTSSIATDAGTAATLLGTIDTDTGAISTSTSDLTAAVKATYETVAASQSAQVLGASGTVGDYLSGVLVIPATTSPGAITLTDNVTAISIFAGGASSVGSLVPFMIPVGAVSASGAWKLTTGANVSCMAIGVFT